MAGTAKIYWLTRENLLREKWLPKKVAHPCPRGCWEVRASWKKGGIYEI